MVGMSLKFLKRANGCKDQEKDAESSLFGVYRVCLSSRLSVDTDSAIFVCMSRTPPSAKGTIFWAGEESRYKVGAEEVARMKIRKITDHTPTQSKRFISMKPIGSISAENMVFLGKACLNVSEVFVPKHSVPASVPWADHVIQDLFRLEIVRFDRTPPPSIYLRFSPPLIITVKD